MSLDGDFGEELELVDGDNELTGEVVPRNKAHAEGLLHRAVYVMLYNSRNELLLQQRHANKALCGGLWDMSAAEHLHVGEAYEAAAIRGLTEELGVPPEAVRDSLTQMLAPQVCIVQARTPSGKWIDDREYAPVYRCRYDGAVTPDMVEVAQVRWITDQQLAEEIKLNRGNFTPWFLEKLEMMAP